MHLPGFSASLVSSHHTADTGQVSCLPVPGGWSAIIGAAIVEAIRSYVLYLSISHQAQ